MNGRSKFFPDPNYPTLPYSVTLHPEPLHKQFMSILYMSLHFFIGGFVYNSYSIPAINSSYLGDVAVSNLTCNADAICTNETIPIDSCDYVHITCIRGKPKGIREHIILYMTVTFQNVKKVM